jgi:hypothetical protein
MTENLNPLPNLLELSLYESVQLTDFTYRQLQDLLTFTVHNIGGFSCSSIDSYCIKCKSQTTFNSAETDYSTLENIHARIMALREPNSFIEINEFSYDSLFKMFNEIEIFERRFTCPRFPNDRSHDIIILLRVSGEQITKIGQFPTRASLENPHIKKYKVLSEEIYIELNRATGLNSSGIGIGALVYLRRIIEKHIVIPELDRLVENKRTSLEEIIKLDFKGKVALVKDQLPEILVDNARIYSILSKGIHALSEKECLEIFNPLLTAIELILDERLEKVEREKKLEKMKNDLNRMTN